MREKMSKCQSQNVEWNLVSGNQAVVHPLAPLQAAPKAGHHVRVHLHQVEPKEGWVTGGPLGRSLRSSS